MAKRREVMRDGIAMMRGMEGMSRKSDMTSMLAEKSKGSSDDYSLSAVVLTRSSGDD